MSAAHDALPFETLEVPLEPGITLVEASAGTGKTFAITRLLLRLLLERKVDQLSQVLIVTFTVKATQELVTRIRQTLRLAERVWSDAPPARDATNNDLFLLRERHGSEGRAIIDRAIGSLDDLAVSTIHGFCQRILAESALESRIPFRTTFIQDETEPLSRAARDWARTRLLNDHIAAERIADDGGSVEAWIKPFVMPYRRQSDTQIALSPDAPDQTLVKDFVMYVANAFDDEKDRRHLLGFDDLLRKLADVLESEGPAGPLAQRIRTRFSAALIDEFQDTDRTQFPIFSTAFHGCPLFLIGDPKQSIFRFRGADIHAYLRAVQSAERTYTLLGNYRSSQAHVSAVEQLFTRAPDPFLVPESQIGYPLVTAATQPTPPGQLATDGGAALEWWWLPASLGATGKMVSKDRALELLACEIVNEIVSLHSGGLALGSVAILVRSNREARDLKSALDKARIPAVIGGDADVLASEEAEELLRLAAAIAAPSDGRAVRAAMATRLWGSDATMVAATLQSDGEAEWLSTSSMFSSARDAWRARGVAVAIGELLSKRNTSTRLLALPDGERRLTNVRHIMELWHDAWAIDGTAPEAMAIWMARERLVPNTPDRRELRLETDSEAVQILTIHKSKGLQFDVVFCPSLWSTHTTSKGPLGVTPVLAVDDEHAVLDLGSAHYAERELHCNAEEQAEALRLAYVALTRGVHRTYVAFGEIGQGNAAGDSALGHLLRGDHGATYERALQELVALSEGAMRLRTIDGNTAPSRLPRASVGATPLNASELHLSRGQLDTWRSSSFTQLASDASGVESATEEARDVADPALSPASFATRGNATGFRAFPAGIKAGVALHELFEQVDFTRATDAHVSPIVQRTLRTHGLHDAVGSGDSTRDVGAASPIPNDLNAASRVIDVTEMVRTVCQATVPHADFALADVAPHQQLREWRFDLSLSTASTRRIADVLESYGAAHAKLYAPVLRTLRESAVGGYLSGVIDVALEHEGRWWIVDWKSNHLGNDDHDYAPERLAAAMMNGHYTLQYHLYALALHRHLQVRQPGYDPAQHFGGIAYVFLRGVTGIGENGWFVDAPSPELLLALDAALGRRV